MERIVIAVVTLGAFACLAAITLEDFGPEVLNKALWLLVTVVGAGLIALATTCRNGAPCHGIDHEDGAHPEN